MVVKAYVVDCVPCGLSRTMTVSPVGIQGVDISNNIFLASDPMAAGPVHATLSSLCF